MSFINTIKSMFSSGPNNKVYWLKVRCRRCGEIIEARIDLLNSLARQDDGTYAVHKTLVGNQRCFERIEARLIFDNNRELVDHEIQRGSLVEEPEA